MKKIHILFYFFFCIKSFAQTMYVSPTGNASVNGQDINNPTTLAHAISLLTSSTSTAVTIYLRGGTYTMTAAISLASSRSGTVSNIKKIWAYPNDPRPVLDFSSMTRATTTTSGTRGFSLSASYWHIKGIDIYAASDNGMYIAGSNNKVEYCRFYENQDSGLQLSGGASNNQIINCDAYYNLDPSEGNADGFACKLDVGTGNSFSGCRAWQNSDDGWDGYMRPSDDVSTVLDNCWAFKNGYLKTGAVATNGNGNGFKMGGSDAKDLRHNMTLTRCLAFQNKVKGFDQNNNRGSMILQNCTAWNNGQNYGMNSSGVTLAAGKVMTLTNCISLTTTSSNTFNTAATFTTNSWSSGFTVSNADFQSIDPTAAYGARQADGSLPDMSFMHLATTSSLINRGTNVGLSFNGSAPDLGCFETNYSLPIDLEGFTVVLRNKNAFLEWKTASEKNNAGWYIERSTPPQYAWENIGFVKGNGTTHTPQYFSFLDENTPSNIIYYRLKQVDFDEKTSFSPIISIDNSGKTHLIPHIFPNPANEELNIEMYINQETDISINLYNAIGQKQNQYFLKGVGEGKQTIRLPLSDLSQGLYRAEIISNQKRYMISFIKKM